MRSRAKATAERLLADLSRAQREAVEHTDGPLLILAGPGSGKTRVVTRRAARLACTVTESSRILAITFTNKAAREMRERIGPLGVDEGMTVCTFHAFCARLLREYHDRAGVPRNFTIFDRDDRRKLLKQAMEKCSLSADNWTPRSIGHDISLAKNDLVTPGIFTETAGDWRGRTVARVYARYQEVLQEMGGLDFDDLLMRVAMLLKQDDGLRDELGRRYRYVLIDEYQDTNTAQYQIARLLTQGHGNICATGDPDQSIYGWRGANIRNILSFERDYPDATVVRLEQNYRSTGRILSAADALIGSNHNRRDKALWTENREGVSVRVLACENEREEADRIAEDIARQLAAGVAAGEIAVFYRVNSLSRVIEEALMKRKIAYQIARGVEFYNRKEIKDVLAYLRVLVNPADEVSLLRIINTPPRGIGAATVKRLTDRAKQTGRSIHDLLASAEDVPDLGRSSGNVRRVATLLSELRKAAEVPASEALKFVISRSGLRAFYHERGDADDEPARNLDELVNAVSEYQDQHPDMTLLDWLEQTALVSDVDTVKDESGTVTLMTLHAAKGLEFSVVYVVGLEEGLLPFRRREDDAFDWEEERRLLFVGMTRAKQRLTLSHARYRMRRGASVCTVRSPFLDELPAGEVEWMGAAVEPRRRTANRGRPPKDIEQWEPGTHVRHPAHGLGRVLWVRRGVSRTHVEVQFQSGSRGIWALEFADLKRVRPDDIGDPGGFPGERTCDMP